ncbi:hypothetical protein BLOT_015141, partial [Blomia tropicalis]
MVFHINPSGYVPIQLIDAHDPIFSAISPIDSNGTFAQNQYTHLPFFLPQSDRTLSNSIKRMINGFVGKFEDVALQFNIGTDIDDGIYDSEDFRLVFNSIAATCKATENDDDDDHLMFRPLTIDDDVDTLGITVFAT